MYYGFDVRVLNFSTYCSTIGTQQSFVVVCSLLPNKHVKFCFCSKIS